MARQTILHVEDDAGVARAVAAILYEGGYHVKTAYGAREGLQACGQTEVDLVILDMSMPGMSGASFLQNLAETGGGTLPVPVLVLTAFSSRINEEVMKLTSGVLLKPVAGEELLSKVSSILNGDTD